MMKKIYYKLTCIILTLFSFIVFLNFNSINSKATTNVNYENSTLISSKAKIQVLHDSQATYSVWANHKQILIHYKFTNKSSKQVAPSDVWSKYFTATQKGHKLITGALAINGSISSSDENAINNSVTPVNQGDTVTAAAMYQINPGKGPVTIHVYNHKHGKQIGKFVINFQ